MAPWRSAKAKGTRDQSKASPEANTLKRPAVKMLWPGGGKAGERKKKGHPGGSVG